MKISSLLLSAWLLTLSNAGYAYQYSITEIGLTGLARQALNNHGEVVGYSGSGNNQVAAYWNNGQIHQLQGLANIYGINNRSEIVGSIINAQDIFKPAVWSNGTLTTLTAVEGEGGYALGINDHGQVIGISEKSSAGGTYVSTFWDNGTPTELTKFPTDQPSSVIDINNAGQVVGYSRFGAVPLLWQNGNYITLDGLNSIGAMNNVGVVVGLSSNTRDSVAAMWVDNQTTVLPGGALPYSNAYDINDQGQIVGVNYYYDPSNLNEPTLYSVAALWANNQLWDLNTLINPASGWTLTSANEINENGQIIGYGLIDNRRSTFLLTPVPEPSTYTLLFAGLGIIACVAKRKSR